MTTDRTPELVGLGMGVFVAFLLAITVTCYLQQRSHRVPTNETTLPSR